MERLAQLLKDLDSAVLKAAPKLHRQLGPPSSPDALAAVRTALNGELRAEVEAWFAWHDGSPDGFVPGTSIGLIDAQEAVKEIEFLCTHPAARTLPPGSCPLMTDRGGGLWIWVPAGEMWTYDRGDINHTEPFLERLDRLLAAWVDEASTLRVAFVRGGRSMMGWQQLELPATSKKKVLSLGPGSSLLLSSESSSVRIGLGDTPRLDLQARPIALVLTPQMLASLKHEDSILLPGDVEQKVVFTDR